MFIWYTILSSIWYKVSCVNFKNAINVYQSYISHFTIQTWLELQFFFPVEMGKRFSLANGKFFKILT